MANISAIKLPDNSNYDLRASAIPYGIVDATSTATAYTVSVPGITALEDGVICILKNGVITSASGFTINVNGLGAKPVYSNMAAASAETTIFNVNYTMIFVYDSTRVSGGCWICYRGYDSNSNTIGEYAGSCTAGTGGMARYSLIMQTSSNTWESVVTTSSTGTSKAHSTSGFLLSSPILYQNGGTYASGNNAANSSCWSIAYNIDTRYTCNVSSSWSIAGRPFYLVGTITNGKFYLKDITWWSDTEPSTEDGYYYWYVGQMSDKYRFSLLPVHPIYYYKDDEVKQLLIDPTVPSWAKESTKPSYDFSEIGSKPTTISGYGITDAKIASGVITLGSNTITPLTSSSTLNAANLSGAIPSAVTATTQIAGNNSTKIATTAYVDNAIGGLPTPMQFIGTVGTNGTVTWANLPTASGHNGYTYKVITAHTVETGKPAADVGDALISNGTEWIVIPAGDETATQSATTGISIAAHGTGTVIGVQSSTTTASKVTLGTAISVPNVTGNTDVTVPIRADADTTVPIAASSATTVPIKNTSATTVPIKNSSATSVPVVSSNNDATLSFAMDSTDTKKLKITWSATPTRTVFGTAASIYGVQSSTTSVTGVQSSTTSVTGVSGSTTVRGVKTGDSSTTTASKVTLGTAKSIPNVTAATDVTVPIKNTSASTFVTGTTHTVTDNGHTHTI